MKRIIIFIPNSITALRIVMTILFVSSIYEHFVYGKDNFISLVTLFSAICISDLLDGIVARKTGCTSLAGAKLDVFADLFFIIISNITLISLGILPSWFLGFICVKFIEFVITSDFIIKHNNSSKKVFIFDKIGRIVSAMFFVIPGLACISQIAFPNNAEHLINLLLYAILAAGIYSSFFRIKSCMMLTSANNVYNNKNIFKENNNVSKYQANI